MSISKGLMPSPKSGTVTQAVADAVKEYAAGKVEYRNDKVGNVHAVIGKMSFPDGDLVANLEHFIRTIEKASGLIASDELAVDPADARKWADCGELGEDHFYPTAAVYNVVVRGDSAGASVRTTVRWTHRTGGDKPDRDCATTYVWEEGLESEVKTRAEYRHAQAAATAFGYEAPATAGGATSEVNVGGDPG